MTQTVSILSRITNALYRARMHKAARTVGKHLSPKHWHGGDIARGL